MSDFKVGDKVVYVGNTKGLLMMTSKLGLSGEVTYCGMTCIKFQSHMGVVTADRCNVRLYNEPAVVSSVEKAIALLTEAGYKVEAPKWENVTLTQVLQGKSTGVYYAATVEAERVEFGKYFTMTFATVEQLYQWVQEAKAFAKKNNKNHIS